jgi:hypothetical protein
LTEPSKSEPSIPLLISASDPDSMPATVRR